MCGRSIVVLQQNRQGIPDMCTLCTLKCVDEAASEWSSNTKQDKLLPLQWILDCRIGINRSLILGRADWCCRKPMNAKKPAREPFRVCRKFSLLRKRRGGGGQALSWSIILRAGSIRVFKNLISGPVAETALTAAKHCPARAPWVFTSWPNLFPDGRDRDSLRIE